MEPAGILTAGSHLDSRAPVPQRNFDSQIFFTWKTLALLFCLTAGAILVHGYHPYVEDAEIYVPGIKKVLNPALYPRNTGFFASHARMTLFPNLIAVSVRITHLPLEWALLLWHFASILLLLVACWHLARLCFQSKVACWGSVTLVASLLTLPVAGTALYLMDQYLNTRSLSSFAVLFLLINVMERKLWRAGLWAIFTILIHPLMMVFGISLALLFAWMRSENSEIRIQNALCLLPLALFPPVTNTYRQILDRHSYFLLLRWHWYEWLGMVGPLLLLWWFQTIARKRKLPDLRLLCRALIVFQLCYTAISLLVSIPALLRFSELQPMRSLHVLYLIFLVIAGGFLAEYVLRQRIWRWAALFVPLCAGMFYAQRQLFPATPHIEWPGASSASAPSGTNAWVRAFIWVRDNTPVRAYFALPPNFMALPGEDQHGFRAIADRSRMADLVKDSGSVSMFPALAETWQQQVKALERWNSFQKSDFLRLKQEYEVDWIVVSNTAENKAATQGLSCPYSQQGISVCKLD